MGPFLTPRFSRIPWPTKRLMAQGTHTMLVEVVENRVAKPALKVPAPKVGARREG